MHNDSIAVSLAPADSMEVRRYGIIGGEHDDVLKLAKKLATAHPGMVLKFCYEAGPRGFALCRCLQAHGLDCILVCPSKVPRKPGLIRIQGLSRSNKFGIFLNRARTGMWLRFFPISLLRIPNSELGTTVPPGEGTFCASCALMNSPVSWI